MDCPAMAGDSFDRAAQIERVLSLRVCNKGRFSVGSIDNETSMPQRHAICCDKIFTSQITLSSQCGVRQAL